MTVDQRIIEAYRGVEKMTFKQLMDAVFGRTTSTKRSVNWALTLRAGIRRLGLRQVVYKRRMYFLAPEVVDA